MVWNLEFSRRVLSKEQIIQAQLEVKEEVVALDVLDPDLVDEEIVEEEIEEPVLESVKSVEPEPEFVDEEPAGESELDWENRAPDVIGVGSPGGPNPFGNRRRERDKGPRRAVGAVDWGLTWLAEHQNADGSWDSDGFESHCDEGLCTGKGHPTYDTGVTGLALLAFLGAGYDHSSKKYGNVVKEGLRYLTRIQDAEGCFGDRLGENYIYGHAICSLAMAEAWGTSKFLLFKRPAQRAVDFIEQARNPYAAWRYGVRSGENDTSVTGWMVMALKSAKVAGLRVSPDAFKGARNFLDSVTDEGGAAGYLKRGSGSVRLPEKVEEFPPQYTRSLTAVGMTARVFLGQDPNQSESIQRGADLLLTALPEWSSQKIDMYYWYYGTLAMYQVGGDPWRKWNTAMQKAILDQQYSQGCEKGSWDPVGAWGEEGGRIYSTALMTLCLEVYYRYPKVFK